MTKGKEGRGVGEQGLKDSEAQDTYHPSHSSAHTDARGPIRLHLQLVARRDNKD
jgi:hypothetical protein